MLTAGHRGRLVSVVNQTGDHPMQPKTYFRIVPILLCGLQFNPAHGAESEATKPTLPLSELILYSSGVGYFQRDGQVSGKASIESQFKVDDINDLLKSMVVQDRDGGQVSTVTYGSRDPITKTLKSFGTPRPDLQPVPRPIARSTSGRPSRSAAPKPANGNDPGSGEKVGEPGRQKDGRERIP